jgi:hypothetical protein
MATPLLSVEEAAAGLVAFFEIAAADKAGVVAEKGNPPARGRRLPPLAGPSPPLLPDLPSPSLPAQGDEGGRERCSSIAPAN